MRLKCRISLEENRRLIVIVVVVVVVIVVVVVVIMFPTITQSHSNQKSRFLDKFTFLLLLFLVGLASIPLIQSLSIDHSLVACVLLLARRLLIVQCLGFRWIV